MSEVYNFINFFKKLLSLKFNNIILIKLFKGFCLIFIKRSIIANDEKLNNSIFLLYAHYSK